MSVRGHRNRLTRPATYFFFLCAVWTFLAITVVPNIYKIFIHRTSLVEPIAYTWVAVPTFVQITLARIRLLTSGNWSTIANRDRVTIAIFSGGEAFPVYRGCSGLNLERLNLTEWTLPACIGPTIIGAVNYFITWLTIIDFLTIPVSSIDVCVRISRTFKTMKFLKLEY